MQWEILTDQAQRAVIDAALRGHDGSLPVEAARHALDWAAAILEAGPSEALLRRADLAAVLMGRATLQVASDGVVWVTRVAAEAA